MNGKLLILIVSLAATVGLSGCTSLTCPAEFARPQSRELLCGPTGNVMSTGSEIYLTPAQYQEWKRRTTTPYVPPAPPQPAEFQTQPIYQSPQPLAPRTATPTDLSPSGQVRQTDADDLIQG